MRQKLITKYPHQFTNDQMMHLLDIATNALEELTDRSTARNSLQKIAIDTEKFMNGDDSPLDEDL